MIFNSIVRYDGARKTFAFHGNMKIFIITICCIV